MKINTSIEAYDVRSLSEIGSTVTEINNQCALLEGLGAFMKAKLAGASDEFNNINYQRTQAAIDSYIKKMSAAQTELTELASSVKAFEEKIRAILS